jgi:hypothetical protein
LSMLSTLFWFSFPGDIVSKEDVVRQKGSFFTGGKARNRTASESGNVLAIRKMGQPVQSTSPTAGTVTCRWP